MIHQKSGPTARGMHQFNHPRNNNAVWHPPKWVITLASATFNNLYFLPQLSLQRSRRQLPFTTKATNFNIAAFVMTEKRED
jgi:hypothetical protein